MSCALSLLGSQRGEAEGLEAEDFIHILAAICGQMSQQESRCRGFLKA